MRRWLTAAVFTAALAFYTYTLQPGLAWGDGTRLQREAITAESFILAEMVQADFAADPFPFARLGVAAWDHPLWVMAAHLLVRAAPFARALWLVNWVSALFGAGTVALAYDWVRRATGATAPALLAAAALAVSHTFWFHAVTPEVYTLFLCLLLLCVRLLERHAASGQRRHLAGALLMLGLAAANHLLAFVAVPALGAHWLWERWARRSLERPWLPAAWRPAVIPAAAFLLGFAPYLVQLGRMLRTFAPGEVMGPALGATFFSGLLQEPLSALAQSALRYGLFLMLQFGPHGVALGAYGLWLAGARHGSAGRRLLALYAAYAAFGLLYHVADQFAFFLTAHVLWALAFGLALAAVPVARRRVTYGAATVLVAAMPFFYQALPGWLRAAGLDDAAFDIPQIGTGLRDGLAYYVNPDKRGDWSAQVFGEATLRQLPADALVIAEWYTDTDEYFVLRYFQAVEGARPDVEVAGWPTVDPFAFDSGLVTSLVADSVPHRPVYLASLSSEFYNSTWILENYCVVEEYGLYRVRERGTCGGV